MSDEVLREQAAVLRAVCEERARRLAEERSTRNDDDDGEATPAA